MAEPTLPICYNFTRYRLAALSQTFCTSPSEQRSNRTSPRPTATMSSHPKLTLYLSPGACSLAPHIALCEAGIPFDTYVITARQGVPPGFGKINPKLRVPVLSIGEGSHEEIVTEVPAIMTAISQLAPEKNLLGRPGIETVRAYEWMNYLSGTIHVQSFGCLWRSHRFSDDEAVHDSIRAKGRKNAKDGFEFIESTLTGDFAVGNSFSAVDAYLYVFWRWGREIGVDMSRFPEYSKLAHGVVARPSAQQALNAENITSWVERA